jgi:hypothetical protein
MTDQPCSGTMTAACNQADIQIVTIGAVLGAKHPMCQACRDAAGRMGMIERRSPR